MTHDVILIQSGYRLGERRRLLERYFTVTELDRHTIKFLRSAATDTLIIFRLERKENDSTGNVVGRSIVDEAIDSPTSAETFNDMSECLFIELAREKANRTMTHLKQQFEKTGVVVLKEKITDEHINHIIKTISSPEVHHLSDKYGWPWLPHLHDFLGDDCKLMQSAYFKAPKASYRRDGPHYTGTCHTASVFIPLKDGNCIEFKVGTEMINDERIQSSWVYRGQPIILDSRVERRAKDKAEGCLVLTFCNRKLLRTATVGN